ncbi:MAG: galactokinase [Cyclobacteriaceae bacterium]|nr:galactokinase [Cyclobacteriaceae bacterium]
MTPSSIREKFKKLFPGEPLSIRSPGRINLIGEHTDYNDGFVMPAAIDREIFFAIAPAENNTSCIHAMKYGESFHPDIQNPEKVDQPLWANYLLGVLRQFVDGGYSMQHFNCVFGGNVPLGAGLSSSAALECGFAFALSELNGLHIPKQKLMFMAQWAEHHFAGVKCGIMDQFASMMGEEGKVMLLDCRSMEFQYFPLALDNHAIVLCDTKVKHALVDSEYNTRRQECERGVEVLKQHYPAIKSLRDVTRDMLTIHATELTGKVFNRCQYIVEEIIRVQGASKDLLQHNLTAFGAKMYETHYGLSKLYEVSCPELDFLVEQAKSFDAVLGSRMMGGGFGGCTINLIRKDDVHHFISALSTAYKNAFGIDMGVHVVQIKDGTSIVA